VSSVLNVFTVFLLGECVDCDEGLWGRLTSAISGGAQSAHRLLIETSGMGLPCLQAA
jgi:hypothetical protein